MPLNDDTNAYEHPEIVSDDEGLDPRSISRRRGVRELNDLYAVLDAEGSFPDGCGD